MIKTIQRLFASHFPNNRRKSLRRRTRPESLAGRPAEGLEQRILLSSITGKLSLDRDADDSVNDEGQSAGIDGVKVSLVSIGNDGAYGTVDDQLFASSTTSMTGAFSFAGMSGGTYALVIDDVYYSTMFGTGIVELTHRGNGTFVSSNFTLSANGATTIDLGLQASGVLEHRLFVLDKVLDLSFPAGGGQMNWGGRNEIWFQGSYNAAGNRWYFLTPDGAFYSWDGKAKASGPFIAQLSSSTYKNPATLSSAKPHLTTSNNVAETAFLLRHLLHIQPAARDFLNSGGTNERWLLGDKNSFGNSWYFIRPDGSFYEWNGVARPAGGSLITKLTSDHYQKLELIFAATNPAATTPELKAVAAADELGLKQSTNFSTNWGGQGEKWLWGKANRFGNHWYYLLPNGNLHEWDGKGRALSGRRLYQLDSQTFSNPSRLFNSAQANQLNATKWNALAVDQTLGLKYTGKSFEGYAGSPDKWLQGTRHDLGNSWYLVEPSGRLLKWDGKPGVPKGVAVANVGGQAAKSVSLLASASPIAVATPAIPEDLSSRFVSLPLRTLDGTSSQFVDITTKLTAGKASFQEIGVFVMDSTDGRVNGILPGTREYAAAVMGSVARQVLFVYGDALQTLDTHRLPANTQLGLYAIGMPGVSMRTGKDHLQIVATGARTGRVAWEEQTSVWPGLGNPKFDDAALELQYSDPIDVHDDCVFDDGLTNWTISETGGSTTGHGTVTAQDCVATLTEGDSFTTTLSTSFVVPPDATSISFTYDNLNFDTSDLSFINDAFEVALIDRDGDSLVPAFAANRDAFFNITEGLNTLTGSGVTITDTTVTLDISGLLAGVTGTLVFRLINNDNNDNDITSSVRLLDLLGIDERTAAIGGTVTGTGSAEVSTTQDVSLAPQASGSASLGIDAPSRGVSSTQTILQGGFVNSGNGSPTLITDPNDSRVWQEATVGTFARLLFGEDNLANRHRVVDEQILDAGIFDTTAARAATLLATPWAAGGVGIGFSHDLTGTGSYAWSGGGGDVFTVANGVDNLWFQSSGRVGDTVFDLGVPSSKAAVFNTIDHGPLPGEAIESTVYLSNDRQTWTQAVVERVWLEGFQANTGILWDGFVYAVGTGTGETFQYVSVIHGGPGALIDDGDDEINGILGLDDFYQPTTRPSLKVSVSAPDREFQAGQSIIISGMAELISSSSYADFGSIEAVFVNGKPVDVLDSTGTFFAQFPIALGDNTVDITALDSFGRRASAQLLLIGTQSRPGVIDLSQMNDVTGAFTGVYGRTSFEAESNQLFVDLATRNDGTFASDVPLLVGVQNIDAPLVTVVGADGFLPDGTPYFDFTQFVAGGKLAPGGLSGSPTISFHNPSRGQFHYDLIFLGKLNDRPEITTVPKIEAIAGKTYTYDVNAIDRDGDNVTYTLIQSPQGMQINSADGQISWVTTTSHVGQHDIQVEVADGRGGRATQRFALNVVNGPPNRPPVITSVPIMLATVAGDGSNDNSPISLSPTATTLVSFPYGNISQFVLPNWVFSDDGQSVEQVLNANPSILLINDLDTVDQKVKGSWKVNTQVDDDYMGFVFGFQDDKHFYLFNWKQVTQSGLGNAGMFLKAIDYNGVGAIPLAHLIGVGDSPGADELYRNTIPWLDNELYGFELDFRPGIFTITVLRENGTIVDSFTINDDTYTSGQFGFYNHSQEKVGYTGFRRRTLPQNYNYSVYAVDPDDDKLTYKLIAGPNGMSINRKTGRISWGPSSEQLGNHPVKVEVSDGRGGVAEQEFVVCVHGDPANHAPVIVSEPLTTTRPDAPYTTTIQAVDPDKDSLAYGLLTGPSGMVIDGVTGALTWTVPAAFAAPVNVSVEARDGEGGTAQQDFILSPPPGQGEIRGSVLTAMASSQTLVKNGSFESGAVDFRTDLVDGFPGSAGTYRVGTDPFLVYGGLNSNVASFGDHTTGMGKMLMVNGSENPGFVNWEQVVEVTPHTEYFFSTWAATFYDVAPARLRFAINGVVVGNTLQLPTIEAQWQRFAASWNSGSATSATIQIRNDTTAFFGNDFVVDDIVFHPVSQQESWIVYIDQNGNHRRDIGELSAVTDTNGDYAFTGLAAGTYVVREDSRFDWQQTFPSQVPPGDGSHIVTITSGQIATGYDFGNTFTGDPLHTRPSFASTPNTSATPQQLYLYNAFASDPNDDPVTYRLVTGPEGMTVHPKLGALVWMPSALQAASYSVVLEASDGLGGLAVQSFTLVVNSLNHAPVFTSTPPATAIAGQTWSYLLAAQDADADPIAFSLESPPAGMTITSTPVHNADGTLIETQYRATWQVPANAAGTNPTITVAASDGKGGLDRQSWTLSILAAGASNSAPVITSTPRPTARVERVWSYAISTNDVNGDEVTLSLTQKPLGMALSAAGVLTWTPAPDVPPSTSVRIVATDPQGAATTQEFTINVVASGANNAPIIVSNPRLRAIEGVDYAADAAAEDADGDELVWILENAPRGMSINSRTGQIRWTPDAEQEGNHTVTLKVVDAFQGESVQSFRIEVACTNTAPAILSVPPTIGISERTYLYAVRADDREGDTLTWRLASAPAGMTIDPKTGVIRWIPTAAQVASHNVVVEASDGLTVGTQAYTIVVYSSGSLVDPNDPSKGTRGNRAPIINSSPVYSADVNKVYNYQVSAVDPDGDSVSLSLTGTVPQGLSMNAAGLISWTPAVAAVGEYLITVQARDTHGGVANQAFLLTVVQNRVPVISSSADTSVTRGALYRYSVRATDPDGDALTYRLDQAPEGMSVDRFGRIIWQTDAANATAVPVRLIVSDDRGGNATQVWDITPEVDAEDPVVSIVITSGGQTYYGNATINQDSVYTVFVSATDNVGVSDIRLLVNGSLVSLDQNRSVTLVGNDLGISELRAIAVDAAGGDGTYDATVSVIDPAVFNRPAPTQTIPSDKRSPIVEITSPAMSATVTNRTPIIGTVDDPENNLWYYRVYTSRVDRVSITNFDLSDPDWAILNTGTQEVINGQLGIFDASSLGNDPYVIAVAAYDANGTGQIEAVLVNVEGNVLVGNFHLELTDLSIPLAGIPIQVTRVYDTVNSDIVGDFGYGWSLGVQDARILEVAAVGEGGAFNSGNDKFVPGRTKVYLTNPDGKRVGFTYQEKLISYSFFGGMWTPYFVPDPGVYDTLTIDETQVARGGIVGALTQGINPDFYTLTTKDGLNYRYSDTAGLQTITDRNANKVTFTEDGIFHSDGESIRFVRDNKGRITSIVDPSGNTIKYAYDLKGDLVKVTNQAALSTRYVYRNDPVHYLDEAYGALNQRVLKAKYDAKDMFVGIFDALENRVDNREFDTANNTGIIRDALGNATTVVYDNRGNVLRETDPQGHVTIREYNDPRNPDLETRIIDRNGNVTTRAYDARGNVTQLAELGPLSNPLTNPVLTTMTYDARNDVTSITNANGASTHFTFDGTGNLTAIVNAVGNVSYITYDTQGRRSSVTDFNGNKTTFDYDDACPCGAPHKVIYADGTYQVFAYNQYGQATLEQWFEANGTLVEQKRTEYDATGRVTREIIGGGNDPKHPATEVRKFYTGDLLDWEIIVNPLSLNPDGSLKESPTTPIANRKSRITDYNYDANSRVVQQIDAMGGIVEFRYDVQGNRVLLQDPVGNITTWVYDTLNRVAEERDPFYNQTFTIDQAITALNVPSGASLTNNLGAAHVRSFGYDAEGNQAEIIDRNNRRREFSYDYAGQLLEERWYAANNGALVETINFTYDMLGNMLTAANTNSGYGYTYDILNRMKSADNLDSNPDTPRVILTYVYDAQGNVTQTYDNLGITVASTYNIRGQLATQRWYDGVVSAGQSPDIVDSRVDYTYDAVGRQKQIRRYSDLTASTKVGSTDYTYDFAGRTDTLVHKNAIDALFSGYNYDYDFSGLVVGEQRDHQDNEYDQTITYNYDLTGQLLDASFSGQDHEQYVYDSSGSRSFSRIGSESRIYEIGPANQMKSDGVYLYQYDGEGNLRTRTKIDGGQITAYTWDLLNRLIQTRTTEADGAGLRIASFHYDPFDRLVEESIDDGYKRYTIFAGDNVWIDTDGSGNLAMAYIFSNVVDQLVASTAPGVGSFQHYGDRLGTIRQISAPDGTSTGLVSYTSFGHVILNSTRIASNRFYFAGREFTEGTTLSFNRTRFLDTQNGRFLSQDRIGFASGVTNLYSYVKNSPVSFTDPSGQTGVETTLLQRISATLSAGARFLGQCVRTSLLCGAIALTLGGNTGVIPKELSKAAVKVCEVVEKKRNPKKLKCKLPSGIEGPK